MSATLEQVHPELVKKATQILAAMDAIGHPMFVVQAARTADYQHHLWLQGRPDQPGGYPGDVVTNRDGYEKKSNHQLHPDGYGHALDLAFADSTWNTDSAHLKRWLAYGALVEALDLTWGGRWTTPHDLPHMELRT